MKAEKLLSFILIIILAKRTYRTILPLQLELDLVCFHQN